MVEQRRLSTTSDRSIEPGEAERVADGLYLLRGKPRYGVNVYLMEDVLLDAGTRHAERRILRQIQALDVRAHVLTHAHMDHMGSSHEVCDRLELPLLCGEADVAAVESGGRAGLEGKPLPVRVQHRLVAGAPHPVSETLGPGDEIAGFTVLHVPGHSPGHLAFWRADDRVLLLGDVLFNITLRGRGRLSLPPRMLTPDPATNLRSAQRLAELEPEVICFGHGPPLRDGEQLRSFVSSAAVGTA